MAANARLHTTYTLKHAITLPDGKVLKEVPVRRVRAQDMRDFEKQKFDAQDGIKMQYFYLSRLTDLVQEDIDLMDAEDFNILGDMAIELVMAGKPKTSDESKAS